MEVLRKGILLVLRRIDGSINTKTEACSLDKGSILMQEYIELRGELKQRISQMDSCCTQCVVFMAAMITAAFSTKNAWITLLIPVVMDFYCLQIFESYAVHERLVEFIVKKQCIVLSGCYGRN